MVCGCGCLPLRSLHNQRMGFAPLELTIHHSTWRCDPNDIIDLSPYVSSFALFLICDYDCTDHAVSQTLGLPYQLIQTLMSQTVFTRAGNLARAQLSRQAGAEQCVCMKNHRRARWFLLVEQHIGDTASGSSPLSRESSKAAKASCMRHAAGATVCRF